jgi:hypothetical protein
LDHKTPNGDLPSEIIARCRFCREILPAGALFCNSCEKFQSPWRRLADGIGFGAILSALPMFAIVFAFLQDRIEIPHSDVSVVPVECRLDSILLGLSNPGNRPALVHGGTVTLDAPSPDRIARDLELTQRDAVVLAPDRTDVVRFGITKNGGVEVGPMPAQPGGTSCHYQISLDVFEFGQTTAQPRQTSCACPQGGQ